MNIKLKNAELSLQSGFELGKNEEMYQGIFKTMVKKGDFQMGKLSPEGMGKHNPIFTKKKKKRKKRK